MGVNLAIAIGALVAAIVPLFGMWIVFAQRTDSDDRTRLADENRDLREQVEKLEEKLAERDDRIADLMSRIIYPR